MLLIARIYLIHAIDYFHIKNIMHYMMYIIMFDCIHKIVTNKIKWNEPSENE